MRNKLPALLLLSALTLHCYAQINEFEKSTKGLLYSDNAMSRLKQIVDSVNLNFKTTEAHYFCRPIARASSVIITGKSARKAKKDMEAGIAFDDLLKKYKNAAVDKELLIWKFSELDWNRKNSIAFEDIRVRFDDGIVKGVNEVRIYDLDPWADSIPVKGRWVYTYYGKTDKYEETVRAFYFTDDFIQHEIPAKYNYQVQYAQSLIDTAALKGPRVYYMSAGQDPVTHVSEFMNYVNSCNERPQLAYRKNISIEEYNIQEQKKFDRWYAVRWRIMDSLKLNDPTFNNLFRAALQDTSEAQYITTEYADYVGRYYSRTAELKLRIQSYMMSGSLYNNPNCQAVPSLKIAKLAAETVNRKAFLHAHLNIINGHFDCTAEIDYARSTKSYLKELEMLDFRVPDLFAGLCLSYLNHNGYYFQPGYLGIALSETGDPLAAETQLLQMISDSSLDDYNRLTLVNLFQYYNLNLSDKNRQTENANKLMLAVKTLPGYLQRYIIF